MDNSMRMALEIRQLEKIRCPRLRENRRQRDLRSFSEGDCLISSDVMEVNEKEKEAKAKEKEEKQR